MAFLTGDIPDEHGGDVSEQDTDTLPQLAVTMALARSHHVSVPLCPICRMNFEERTGARVDVTLFYPSFCPAHIDWQAWPDPILARRISQVALDGSLWPRLDAVDTLDNPRCLPGPHEKGDGKEGGDGHWS